MIKLLRDYIKEINKLHKEVSVEFASQNNCNNFNLSSTTIKKCIDLDETLPIAEFNEELEQYRRFSVKYVSRLDAICADIRTIKDVSARSRLKQADSIYNKLSYYRKNAETMGDSPINKCLNDIIGIRIIVSNDPPIINELCEMLNGLKVTKHIFKWVRRDLSEYKALHIYFKNESNLYFPWELQIWENNRVESNTDSHAEHKDKRSYIEWPANFQLDKK